MARRPQKGDLANPKHLASHGLEIDGEALLLGVDFRARTKKRARLEGFSVSELVELIGRARASVVVIDACRNNPFARSLFRSTAGSSRGLSSSSIQVSNPHKGGVYLVFSTTKGSVAQDGDQLSPFVSTFKKLSEPHGSEPVSILFGSHIQGELQEQDQELEIRILGRIPADFRLRALDSNCSAACQPRCDQSCVKAQADIARYKREMERTRLELKRIQGQTASSTPKSTSSSTPTGETSWPTTGAPCVKSLAGCPDIKWAHLKGGSFTMGVDRKYSTSSPAHKVTVSSFWIADSEVTVQQYKLCVDAGVCSEPRKYYQGHPGAQHCHWGRSGRERFPVNCLNWGQARTFSKWVGGDLPTEAQWEYAAQGDAQFKDDQAHDHTPSRALTPIRKKRPNRHGLYDMNSNAAEWTLDEWHGRYDQAPSHGDKPWGGIYKCKLRCDMSLIDYLRYGQDRVYRENRVDRYPNKPSEPFSSLGFRPRLVEDSSAD